MRNISKTVGALAAASTLVAGNAMAELEGEVHVGYSNMYEFRFFDYGNDLIYSGVDLAWDAGPFGLSAGAWYGSFDAPTSIGSNARVNFDELDLYAAANYSIGDFTMELGYIYYYFPDTSGSLLGLGSVSKTQEVYFGVNYDFNFGLGIASTIYYDFDANSGWYWDTNIGYSWDFNECLSLDLGAGIAFSGGNAGQFRSDPLGFYSPFTENKDGYNGYYLTAALPWEFRDGVTLTPYVKYTNADVSLSTDYWGTGGQDYLIGGVSLAVGF